MYFSKDFNLLSSVILRWINASIIGERLRGISKKRERNVVREKIVSEKLDQVIKGQHNTYYKKEEKK